MPIYLTRYQGHLDAAMAMYEKALAIRVKALEPDHASFGDTCYTMAGLQSETEANWSRALALYTQARDIYSAAYGAEHAEVADANQQMARIATLCAGM